MSRIPTMYSAIGGPEAPEAVKLAIAFVCGALQNHQYTHILANTPPQEGTLKGLPYLEEGMYQHGEGYLELMGLPELIPEAFQRQRSAALSQMTGTEMTLKSLLKMAAEADAILEHRAAQVQR